MRYKLKMQLMYIAFIWIILMLGSCERTISAMEMEVNTARGYRINLPEEWEGVSTNQQHPDTLVAYKDSNGVVRVSFSNARNR